MTAVGTVHAVDMNTGLFSALGYSLSGTKNDSFHIDSNTVEISLLISHIFTRPNVHKV